MRPTELSPRQAYRLQIMEEQAKRALRRRPELLYLPALDLGVEWGASGELLRELGLDVVGVDAVDVRDVVRPGVYSALHLSDACRFLRCNFLGYAFGVIVCAELLEHYHRAAGLELLAELEAQAAAGAFVVLTTPRGFMPQGAIDGNPWQVHRSGWEAGELEARGWRVVCDDEQRRLIVATLGAS